jgi:hypothetical protein
MMHGQLLGRQFDCRMAERQHPKNQ